MNSKRNLILIAGGCLIVACGALVFVGLIGLVIVNPDFQRAVIVASFPTPTPDIPQSGSPSYAKLCDPNLTSNLTQVQADAYAKKLIGTTVTRWSRYVYQVDSAFLSTKKYEILLSGERNLSSWNIQVLTSDPSAENLNKGDWWTFDGKITDAKVVSRGVCMFYIDAP